MMEIRAIHKNTQWWLFKFADKILSKGDLYKIGYDPDIGYTVNYRYPESQDAIYKVIKGHDEHGFKFVIEKGHKKYTQHLKPGDILLFELEYEGLVWFTCTTMIFRGVFADPQYSYGMTEYGGIATMLNDGLIEKAFVL